MNFKIPKFLIYLLLGLILFFISSQVVGFSSNLADMFLSLSDFVKSL